MPRKLDAQRKRKCRLPFAEWMLYYYTLHKAKWIKIVFTIYFGHFRDWNEWKWGEKKLEKEWRISEHQIHAYASINGNWTGIHAKASENSNWLKVIVWIVSIILCWLQTISFWSIHKYIHHTCIQYIRGTGTQAWRTRNNEQRINGYFNCIDSQCDFQLIFFLLSYW